MTFVQGLIAKVQYKGQYSLLFIDISFSIDHHIPTKKMLSILVFLLLSSTNAQYYQQKYPSNNYNQWLPYPQNYPVWKQGIQPSKLVDCLIIYCIEINSIRSTKCTWESAK